MRKTIYLLPGDGIGGEIIPQAVKVLDRVAAKFKHSFAYNHGLIGGAAIDAVGEPLTQDTIKQSRRSDAILLGAVGGPQWDSLDKSIRPERGILGIRKALDLFANLRPAILFKELASASYLRPDIVASGIDVMVVRELTSGLYFGQPKGEDVVDGQRRGFNTMSYTENEVRRVAKVAFELAGKRKKILCSVDKANVLESSQFWREIVCDEAKNYPEIALEHMYVDNAAMQLVRKPSQFDVIVTENTFGDILSDEASAITGSIGMLPSASIGLPGTPALYEPIHGSAPDIAGQDKANPLAAILSAAMMLRLSFKLMDEAQAIENAVQKTLAEGFRTSDLMTPGHALVGCSRMGDLVAERL